MSSFSSENSIAWSHSPRSLGGPCRVRVDADLLPALKLDDPGIVDDDFHGAVADLLKGTKDLLRQLAVCLVYEPVGVLPGGVHFLFRY